MTRRDFLRLSGLAAGVVAFGGVSALASPDVLDAQFMVGDVFTIAGYNAVNPITGGDTGFLQCFVVTAVVDGEKSQIDFFPKLKDIPARHRKQPMSMTYIKPKFACRVEG